MLLALQLNGVVDDDDIQELKEEGGRVPEADWAASGHLEVATHQPLIIHLSLIICHLLICLLPINLVMRLRIAQESFARADAAEKLLKETKDKVANPIKM